MVRAHMPLSFASFPCGPSALAHPRSLEDRLDVAMPGISAHALYHCSRDQSPVGVSSFFNVIAAVLVRLCGH